MRCKNKRPSRGTCRRSAALSLAVACCLSVGGTAYADFVFDYFRNNLQDGKVSLTESDTAETEAEPETESETEHIQAKTDSASVFLSSLSEHGAVTAPFAKTVPEEAPGSLLRTLKDYYELRNFQLPQLPLTIQVLENRLTQLVESYSGQWSIYIKNLTTGDSFTINDTPMKSASVMKLFIMGTVYNAIEKGELERTQEVVDLLRNMICYSSNSDSNQLLSLLGSGSYEKGIEKVNQYIADENFSSATHEYNGFNDSSTVLDSDHFNQVSAKDCGTLLEQVYHRAFGSRKVCNEIEDMMLNQDTRYKIPAGLPEGVLVGNKTGEMDTVENDTAVIYGDKSDYILCVLSSDWDNKNEAISHIAEISSMVYDFFDEESYYQNASLYKIVEYSSSENLPCETESPIEENDLIELETQEDTQS